MSTKKPAAKKAATIKPTIAEAQETTTEAPPDFDARQILSADEYQRYVDNQSSDGEQNEH